MRPTPDADKEAPRELARTIHMGDAAEPAQQLLSVLQAQQLLSVLRKAVVNEIERRQSTP